MKNYAKLWLIFLTVSSSQLFANQADTDTVGRKISRTQKVIETTVFVEEMVDSIVDLNSPPITTVKYDTIKASETIITTDTNFMIAKPLRYWTLESKFAAALNQIARWNWAAGGGNLVSILLSNNSSAIYERGPTTWKTELDWVYGVQKQDTQAFFKNQDRFNLQSQYGFRASHHWFYSALFQFNTQISKSYESATSDKKDYKSRWLSPARITFSLGMEYVNHPKTVTLFLSPVALRATYVNDTTLSTRFGVNAHEHWLTTFGPMAMLTNKHQLTSNITLGSKLQVFANILQMQDPFAMVDWKVNLDVQLTRYLTLGIETWLIYDPTVKFDKIVDGAIVGKERRTQFQESLLLRFAYRIAN